jgi:hypothetical protein
MMTRRLHGRSRLDMPPAKKATPVTKKSAAPAKTAAQATITLKHPAAELAEGHVSMAETNCASWRRESVPVGLGEKGSEALVDCRNTRCEPSCAWRSAAHSAWRRASVYCSRSRAPSPASLQCDRPPRLSWPQLPLGADHQTQRTRRPRRGTFGQGPRRHGGACGVAAAGGAEPRRVPAV